MRVRIPPPALAAGVHVGRSEDPEGYPSGQREQTVNLPASAYVGSNPTPSTLQGDCSSEKRKKHYAGIAQLVERQPSKLNVAGSNPVSRSTEGKLTSEGAVKHRG